MPSQPIDYKTGKIYKLCSYQTNEVYIGSTTKKYLRDRFRKHKSDKTRYLQGKKATYVTSFKLLDFDDCDIILIEDYPCENKQQLHARERYWIENTPNCVNKVIPTRTQKEYREDNREKIALKNRNYKKNNYDKIRARLSEKMTCECGGEFTSQHKVRHTKSQMHIKYMESKQT